MSLVERQVPEQRLTEGMTWLLAGFTVALCAGAAVLVMALCVHQRLRVNGSPIADAV